MTYITTVQFLALADSLGYQMEQWEAVNESDEADDLRTAADANVARLLAYGTPAADLIARLIGGANAVETQAATLLKSRTTIFADVLRALDSVGVLGVSGVDAYLTANAIQVGPSFRRLYEGVLERTLTAANVNIGRVEGP